MPPKSRGRGRARASGRDRGRLPKAVPQSGTEEPDSDNEAGENSSAMSGHDEQKKSPRKKPAMEPRFPQPTGPAAGTPTTRASSTRQGRRNAAAARDDIPEVLREMVQELAEKSPERPLKKRKIRGRGTSTDHSERAASYQSRDDDSSIQFEDVTIPSLKQTVFRESDDESDENDAAWEEVDVDRAGSPDVLPLPSSGPSTSGLQDLDLNLSINTKVPQETRNSVRRKPVSKEEANVRICIHKMHILCLLAHVDIRNKWCNDSQVHDSLRPLLTASMMKFFNPAQGGDAEKMNRVDSIKAGLNFAGNIWRNKFRITARGIRRALWADREEDLQDCSLPDDIDRVHDIDDFRTAAKELKGSRDLGAQLYCAFLRCAGLDVRLACSLQPLPFKRTLNEPSMPVTPASKKRAEAFEYKKALTTDTANLSTPSIRDLSPTNTLMPVIPARRRLGNSSTAGFSDLTLSRPAHKPPSEIQRVSIEGSAFPVYWVEVLSAGTTVQWVPADPLVLNKIDHRITFEPPATDKENSMRYVIAFEDDGRAREVTRRYTKAYNSKTRKLRVESTEGGEKWWSETMGHFSRGFVTGVDDLEDLELARYEAQEPMPNNATDFKDHAVYALEQHLKRNEVLVGKEIGKYAAGIAVGEGFGRKTKKLVSVYRRRDVKSAKSAEGWYRIGREVKVGEQPVKTVPARRKADDNMEMDDDGQDRAGVGLYTEDQTQAYEAYPVVNGRVPTNTYGNLDIYVPSMVPKGGVHIPDPEAKLAARIIGVHSADAVTGFEFRGRHGTAVIRGIVVAIEFQEAIEAVIQGLRDEQRNTEDERRTLKALRMWKKFMIGLRVKERIAKYEVEGEIDDKLQLDVEDSGMESEEYVDDGAGGFFLE